eukprot:TRINITY_DN50365_c0_g1_i1.p1 TRINITY_DN50365_c0_g1~~TRINITY_DN50365_c0_g1_i1.p1  ORF type:complete len:597 (+),score=79.30 TRINITY_DN50365_c0_g1_i1:71-1861(+)
MVTHSDSHVALQPGADAECDDSQGLSTDRRAEDLAAGGRGRIWAAEGPTTLRPCGRGAWGMLLLVIVVAFLIGLCRAHGRCCGASTPLLRSDGLPAESRELHDTGRYLGPGAPGHCAGEPCTAAELFGEARDYHRIGVNIGGWLVLEDWFFSNARPADNGQFVSSKGHGGEGGAFPFACHARDGSLLDHYTWPSEGDLTTRLMKQHLAGKGPDPRALFAQHRQSFLRDEDYEQIAALSLRQVRIPLPWQMFADTFCYYAPKSDHFKQYCLADPEDESYVVTDPYYDEVYLVTVPRSILRRAISKLHAHNVGVVLDLHTMPGGASDGTYASTWPRQPAFWQRSVHGVPLSELGLSIAAGLVDFVSGLTDLKAAVKGVTLLNEPAMMARGGRAYGGAGWLDSQQDIFEWLTRASALFERRRPAFDAKTKLILNLHDSAFKNPSASPSDDPALVWFKVNFAHKDWVTLDKHFYQAWSFHGPPSCSEWTLGELERRTRWFMKSSWEHHPALYGVNMEGRKAMTEFSSSTYSQVAMACRDANFLRAFFNIQVREAAKNGVEAFFWTWRMPEGGIFQDGWSLKKIAGYERETHGRYCGLYGG